MVNRANIRETFMLDRKMGDVNGDRIPDTVYLTGEMGETPFYENIKVIVQDGRTMQRYTIPLHSNYSMSTSPWLFLGNFSNYDADDIMVNLPTPGSGALTYYYVISFLNNNANYVLIPEQFSVLGDRLEFEVKYMDNYKVLVRSKKLNQSYILDISDRKEVYEGTLYGKDGKLIAPREGFVITQPHLYPIKFDGNLPYKLEAQMDIAGTSRADQLGSIITYWRYSEQNKSWVLDPEKFFIMI
jgi:hypothetical protein